ncbi:UNVERIFIED_CONTAM: hypothetical protein FKN15_058147 [Acipenser sinensis]
MMNKSCNLTTENVMLIRMVMDLPVFIIGLILNTIALVVFCRKGKWTEIKIYMTNLVISDVLLLFFLPFKMYSYNYEWMLETDLCRLLVSVYYVNMYVSILTITTISIDRYIAIKHPFRAKSIRSPLEAGVLCILIWITVCTLSVGFFKHSFHFQKNSTAFKCFQKDEIFEMPFVYVTEIVGFVLPLITVFYCSAQSVYTLLKAQHIGPHEENSRSIHMLTTNAVVFVVCFTPFHVGFLLKFLVQIYSNDNCSLGQKVHIFFHAADWLASTNCCLDAVFYYFAAKEFRDSVFSPMQNNAQGTTQRDTQSFQMSSLSVLES